MDDATFDRELVGRLLAYEMPRRYGSWPAMDRATGISRATLARVVQADPGLKRATYRRVEAALGYPFDALDSIASHDFATAAELGVDPTVIAWLTRLVASGDRQTEAGTA